MLHVHKHLYILYIYAPPVFRGYMSTCSILFFIQQQTEDSPSWSTNTDLNSHVSLKTPHGWSKPLGQHVCVLYRNLSCREEMSMEDSQEFATVQESIEDWSDPASIIVHEENIVDGQCTCVS